MAPSGLGVDGGVARIVVKRALMVAFHYPPAFGSSGVQRALKFSQYLPEFGWLPLACSPRTRARTRTAAPRSPKTCRRKSSSSARSRSMRRLTSPCAGAIRAGLALPDRWGSWMIGGLPAGLALIRKYRPESDLVHLSDRDGDAHGYLLHP